MRTMQGQYAARSVSFQNIVDESPDRKDTLEAGTLPNNTEIASLHVLAQLLV